jgi:hypothetical protein
MLNTSQLSEQADVWNKEKLVGQEPPLILGLPVTSRSKMTGHVATVAKNAHVQHVPTYG